MNQLKGIARNLNQLTKLANVDGFDKVADRHDSIVREIESYLKQIRDDR